MKYGLAASCFFVEEDLPGRLQRALILFSEEHLIKMGIESCISRPFFII